HRALRSSRRSGAQDGHPVRALPRVRFGCGPLLGPGNPGRVLFDAALAARRSLCVVERRGLPGTELQITPVGVGTAPIGSGRDWPVWWGPQDEAESIRTIHSARGLGVNWIETAPFYGWGRAEEIVGRALRGRDDVLVFTKCGTFPEGMN